MNERKILEFAVYLLLLINILSFIYLQFEISNIVDKKTPTAMALGRSYICVNHAPNDIDVGTCNFTMPWGIDINCTVNATDPDNDSIYYYSYFVSPENLFTINSSGQINVNLPRTAIGNHTIRITSADLSGCDNNVYFEDFNIEVYHINHAPYLYQIIPNRSLLWDTVFVFYLNDYFRDIDEDNMTYLLSQEDNLTSINIVDDLVTIRGVNCGESRFFFIASDPEGLTATSNIVTYTIVGCPIISGNNENAGRGGGGGGGSYSECIPDWRCSKWSECQENGTRQLRCIDYNGCNPNNYIKYFTENCTYIPEEVLCEEKWECTEWSLCINQTHTRTCVDKNECGTEKNKPAETESCTPIPSCFNGIQDGDETGVDCGGPCGACKSIEQPLQAGGIDNRLILAAIILVASLTIVILSVKKQLKEFIDKIIALSRRKKQPTYITEHQKQKLLNILFKLQDDINNEETKEFQYYINQLVNLFFVELLGLEIVNYEKVKLSIKKIKNKQLEDMLLDFYKNMNSLKLKGKNHIQEVIDSISDHIYLISEFHDKDALVLPKEREINAEGIDRFYQKLSNIHIALEFKEILEAKNLYKELLDEYNRLSHEKKAELYDEMMTVYNIILYLDRFY
ncbi:MAG: hypothetical protein KatS3mg002_0804 [Candidatus Woesearchaeota archaeon]|nr:MAG: hypothetical protein KatS3mg002_0804 [Candidatus Woesearchaeota archaeon]